METVTITTVISLNPSHEADPVSLLEAPRPHSGGPEDGLVVRLSGHCSLADLTPVHGLASHVSLGIQFASVDQVGDQQVLLLLLVGHGAASSMSSTCFSVRVGWVPTISITLTGPAQPFGPAPLGPAGLQFAPKSRTMPAIQPLASGYSSRSSTNSWPLPTLWR